MVTPSPTTTPLPMNAWSPISQSRPILAPGRTCTNAPMRVPSPTHSVSTRAVSCLENATAGWPDPALSIALWTLQYNRSLRNCIYVGTYHRTYGPYVRLYGRLTCCIIRTYMAITIAVANQKGGCGKTTACMNLAGGLARAGYKVLVVDADPQGSATKWRNMSEESRLPFQLVAMATASIHRELPAIIRNASYEVVLIDCPPGGAARGDGATRSA